MRRSSARVTSKNAVRLALAVLCVMGLWSVPFQKLYFPVVAGASYEEDAAEVLFVRGCDEPASADARETTGCFAVAAAKGQPRLPKSVVLSLEGVHLPTDLHDHRVLLKEYRRPSLLGDEPSAGEAANDAAAAAVRDAKPVQLLCERPNPSELFPTQLITCELVNPLITMNRSEVWRSQLQRLVDATMWFDVRLEVKRGDADTYHAVSILRRSVQLQVTNISKTGEETGDEMLKRQRRAVSWEEVRRHPLERLYAPDSFNGNATKVNMSSSSSEDETDLYESSGKVQNGEEVWVELGIGGLKRELRSLFRRVFLSRLPSLAPLAEALQLQHVRGVILYGPPGNGKTLIARNLFRLLGPDTRLSVVNAADILSKFVGESEKNLRDVFEGYDISTSLRAEDAEKDREGFEKSQHKAADVKPGTLQVLVIDEFEALFRRRGHSGDESSAKAVYDGVTNTLLSLMDGVKSRNDLLVVGLTNRLQAIDQALLRPGRFEVLIEIPAPDVPGREDIFFIHTDRLREHGFLAADVNLHLLALESGGFSGSDIAGTVRSAVSYALLRYRKDGLFAKDAALYSDKPEATTPHQHSAADAERKRAEEEGEEFGHRPGDIGGVGLEDIPATFTREGRAPPADAVNAFPSSTSSTSSLFRVTRADFDRAMRDIRSAKDEASALSQLSSEGDGAGAEVVDYDGTVTHNIERASAVMERVTQSERTMTGLIAITGAPGTGKSTVARALTRVHDFTTVRYFSCRRLTELRDREEQLAKLRDALSEASHTERGLVVLDDYDVLVDSMGGSGGYAALTLRGLLYEYLHRPGGVSRALVADSPLVTAEEAGGEAEAGNVVVNAGSRVAAERNRRVLVLTSSLPSVLQPLPFDVHLRVHPILRRGAATLLTEYRVVDAAHAARAAAAYPVSMSYRTFLRITDMALQRWIQQATATASAAASPTSGNAEAMNTTLELPAFFATSEAMRDTYETLQEEQALSNFYSVSTDAASRDFVSTVRATVANMGLMDPYEGWGGEGDEDGGAAEGEGDALDDKLEDAEERVDIDELVGAADEILW